MKNPKVMKPKAKKSAVKARDVESSGIITAGKTTDSVYSISTELPTLVLESGRLSLVMPERSQNLDLSVYLYGPSQSGKSFIGNLDSFIESDYARYPSIAGLTFDYAPKIPAPPEPETLPADALMFSVSVYDRSGYYHSIDTERAVPVSQEPEKGPQGPAINKIVELLGKPPAMDFAQAVTDSRELSHAVRSEIAARIEPALNAHIRTMPGGTLDEKKAICEVVETTLEPLGLAVQVPNTPGLPGKLKATAGNWPGVGRFHFEVYVDGQREKPAVSDNLPELKVIDSTPAIEAETPWQSKVGPKSSRHGRKRS